MKVFTLLKWRSLLKLDNANLEKKQEMKNTFYASKRFSFFLLTFLFSFLLFTSNIYAQHPYGFLDGNVLSDNTELDWDDVYADTGLPPGSISTGIVFDVASPDDIFTGGSTKDHLPLSGWLNKFQNGSSSDKTNIQQAGAILIDGRIYFFGNRFSNEGSTNIGFWFFQDDVNILNGSFDGEHQVGDILVVAEISQGGAVGKIAAYQWVGKGNGDLPGGEDSLIQIVDEDNPQPNLLSAVVNAVSTTTPWPYQGKGEPQGNTMQEISFFEGFINIADLQLSNACFSSFLVETRASFSVTSVLEDFVGSNFNVQPTIQIDDITDCKDKFPKSLVAKVNGGISPLTFEWKKDGGDFPGNGPSIMVSENGTYSVIVTGQGIGGLGTCPSESDSAIVTIIDNPEPIPTNLDLCERSEGDLQAVFNLNNGVTANGTGAISFHLSQADADNGTNAIGSPDSYLSGDDIVFVREENQNNEIVSCYGTTSFTLTVYDNPDPIPTNLDLCERSEGDLQAVFNLNSGVAADGGGAISFHLSQADADNGTNAIGSPDSYLSGDDIIYVREENPNNEIVSCYGTTSFTLTVYDNPDPIPANLDLCERSEGDLQAVFNLNSGVTADGGGTISFHLSQADADSGANAIGSPGSYLSVDDIIYVREENPNDGTEGCYGTTSFTLTVYDNPDPVPTNLDLCERVEGDLKAVFNLNSGVAADGVGAISFHLSQADADSGANAIGSPGSYLSGDDIIYVREENPNDGTEGCYGTTSFTLTVYDNPDPVPTNLDLCERVEGDLQAVFNLNSGVAADGAGAISFHLSQVDADSGANAIGSPGSYLSGDDIIYVREENPNDGTEGCYGTTSFTLTVYDNPDPVPTNLDLCERSEGDLQAVFNLNSGVAADGAGALSFHLSQADADSGANAIGSPGGYLSGDDIIYVREENPNDGTEGCYGTTSFTLTVYDNPDLEVEDLEACEDGITGGQDFDLDNAISNADGGTVTFYASLADANNAANAISNSQNVLLVDSPKMFWARSDNNSDGNENCHSIASFEVTVYDNPDLEVQDLSACEVGSSGSASFDLDASIVNADGGTISFYNSQADAMNLNDPIEAPEKDSYNSSGGEIIWVRSDNNADGGETCFTIKSFEITIGDNPDLVVKDLADCEEGSTEAQDFDLNDGVTANGGGAISFHLSQADAENDANAILNPTSVSVGFAGDTYWVRSENTQDASCFTVLSIDITVHPNPDGPSLQIPPNECFSDPGNFIITSNTTGLKFSIDGGPFLVYPEGGYVDISVGDHTITARSEFGCLSDPVPFTIFPPFDVPVMPILDGIQPTCELLTGTIIVSNHVEGQTYYIRLASEVPNPVFIPYPIGGFTGFTPGDYIVLAQSADQCSSDAAPITLIEPICDNFEGCTLGYWKNHTDRWECYSTCTPYGEVFTNAPSQLANLSLQAVLNLGGGGIYNLGRQSVAALLNTCHGDINYEILSTDELIAYVNANFNKAGAAGSYLDELNNAGCTLGGSRATTAPSEGCDAFGPKPKPGKNNKAGFTASFKAYPVPFRESLNIQYEFNYKSDVSIEFFDLQGRLLRTYKARKVSKGDVTNLDLDFATRSSQVYIIKVKTNREVFTKNIISDK